MYLHMVLFENEIALSSVNKENVVKVQDDIDEIKEIFADYLS